MIRILPMRSLKRFRRKQRKWKSIFSGINPNP
jgi:hypothetical protein